MGGACVCVSVCICVHEGLTKACVVGTVRRGREVGVVMGQYLKSGCCFTMNLLQRIQIGNGRQTDAYWIGKGRHTHL